MAGLAWLTTILLSASSSAQWSDDTPDWTLSASASAGLPGRPAAPCQWRLDAPDVWECRPTASVNKTLVRPDYRAAELRVLCETSEPGTLDGDLFDSVSRIRRLEIRQCNLTHVHKNALDQFVALKHVTLRSSSDGALAVSEQTFHRLQKLESLDMSGNHITYLPNTVFCRQHRLLHLNLSTNGLSDLELGFDSDRRGRHCGQTVRELDVSANGIRAVRARAFQHLISLQRLFLSGNRIEKLSDESFQGLDDLRLLDVSGNRLVSLSESVLKPTPLLRILRLQANSLRRLPTDVFTGLDQLVSLNLSQNQLTSPGEFAGLLRLLQLDLSQNQLTSLAPGFRRMNSLQVLDLSRNKLEQLAPKSFVDLGNLAELDLSHNQLNTIPDGVMVNLRGLTVLRLQHNRLVALQPLSLANCSGIQQLHLQHNRLQLVPAAVKSLSLLHELNLAHNQIQFVEDHTFAGLRSLLSLDLSQNQLTNLSTLSLTPLKSLTHLRLSHNQLTSLQEVLRLCLQLTDVDVSSNRLTDIMGLATHLPNLQRLNVSHNALTWFDYGMIPAQLRVLDISANKLRSLEDKYQRPSSLQLRELDASANQLTNVTRQLLPDSIEIARLRGNHITGVAPYSFAEKTYLQLVDLAENELESLEEKAVRLSVERAEFRLAGNPLVCDCHSEWLTRQTGQLAVTDLDQVMCHLNHHGAPVRKPLSSAWFLCSYKRHCFTVCQCCEFDACDCEQTCPTNCTCLHNNMWTTNIIMCSRRELITVPSTIPMDATDIMLDGNDLDALYDLTFLGRNSLRALFLNSSKVVSVSNRTFQGLTSLRLLFLQNNWLTQLEGEEMMDLTSLRELYLNKNLLQYVSAMLFKNMESLEVLDLSENQITHLAVWTLPQPYLARVSLANNLWQCECSFRFRFRRWLLEHRDQVVDADSIACFSSGDVIVRETECLGIQTSADSSLWIYFTAAGLVLVAAAALLAALAYRRYRRRKSEPSPCKSAPPPYVYDLFVSHDASDAAAAARLSAELPFLRLCVLHHDVAATPESIVDAIHSSRATVILLTEGYVNRAWCEFAFKHAHLAGLGSARRPLILLDAGGVTSQPDLDPDLSILARRCPVLNWHDHELGRRLLRCLQNVFPPTERRGKSPLPFDDYADSPVYASIDDAALVQSPSLVVSEKGTGKPRLVVATSVRSADGRTTPKPSGKVQLTPSYFV